MEESRNIASQASAPQGERPLRGILLAFIGAACWGFSANCVSWLTTYTVADVLWLSDMRLIFAGILFLGAAAVFARPKLVHLMRSRHLWGAMAAYTLVGVILMQISYMSAIKYTNPGTALLLQESGVPLILVISCLKGRCWPRKSETVALLLAIFGIVLIATQGDVRTLSINPLGLFWGLASGVALAGYNILSVKLMEECGALVLNAVSLTLGALVLTPFVRPWEVSVGFGLDGWAVFFAVVVVGTMLAYGVYLKGVMDAGPVRASLIGVFEPVSGAIIAALWLGTVFTTWDLIGGIAILVMMVIVARKP